ncbi:MAG: hypothetical protein HY717_23430 [Planctomycetes bacterium]|nr:hypothetical protein [Planctomycetota bacterium]
MVKVQRGLFLAAMVLGAGTIISIPVFVHGGDGQEGDDATPVKFGFGKLSPPEGAADQDASGSIHLKQKGDRSAIHVHVRNLEPGATYDVQVTKGETTEKIGSITTHDGNPPPPRCFSAKLSVPPPPAGEGVGGHHPEGDQPATPRGYAIFHLNEERTQLKYWIVVRGLGEIASAELKIGDATVTLETDGIGRLDVNAEQLAALAAGQGSVTVTGAGDPAVTITGSVQVCFEEKRERIAAHRAGRGALRLDTARGDKLPLGALGVADLVGATFSVVDSAGNTVLTGAVAELMEGGFHRPNDGGHGGNPPGADEPCEADLTRPDPAPDADAVGDIEIEGEELEVEVARLEAHTVYDVILIQPGEGGASASIGQLKTGWRGAANHEFKAVEGTALPFGKTKISEFVGHGVEIKNPDGAVVLKGAIPAIACAPEEMDRKPGMEGGGGALPVGVADSYFQLDEKHDASFIRGDANDDGAVDVSDVVSTLRYLFLGMEAPYCPDAADSNDNGEIEISDPVLVLLSIFQGSGPIRAPYPEQDFDPTADESSCRPFSG